MDGPESDIQNEAILQNLDALQNDLTTGEKRDIIRLCIKKIVLTAKDIYPHKKDFLMAIFPTESGQTAFHSSSLEVLFSLDNSNGIGEWIITSPFELKCDNFGKVSRTNTGGKIKRHWLHDVARWQKEYDAGNSLDDIAKGVGVGKSMICRKLKLLNNLSTDVIEAVLKLKYEKDTTALTFRRLDALAALPKDRQKAKF